MEHTATMELFLCSRKAVLGDTEANVCGSVPVELLCTDPGCSLDWVQGPRYNLLTPDLTGNQLERQGSA